MVMTPASAETGKQWRSPLWQCCQMRHKEVEMRVQSVQYSMPNCSLSNLTAILFRCWRCKWEILTWLDVQSLDLCASLCARFLQMVTSRCGLPLEVKSFLMAIKEHVAIQTMACRKKYKISYLSVSHGHFKNSLYSSCCSCIYFRHHMPINVNIFIQQGFWQELTNKVKGFNGSHWSTIYRSFNLSLFKRYTLGNAFLGLFECALRCLFRLAVFTHTAMFWRASVWPHWSRPI